MSVTDAIRYTVFFIAGALNLIHVNSEVINVNKTFANLSPYDNGGTPTV